MPPGAVITGDIVASTQLSKAELTKLLKNMHSLLASYPHEFFRGDSFQVVVKPADDAFLLLLKLRTAAKKITASTVSDIRASIGIGNLKQPVKNIRTASEEAFVLSGRIFEQLKPAERLCIAAPEKNIVVNKALHVIAYFTDYLFERMTVKQAEVVYELLSQKTQKDVAKTLKKSQATVHKHAQAAGWPQLETLLGDYRSLVNTILS